MQPGGRVGSWADGALNTKIHFKYSIQKSKHFYRKNEQNILYYFLTFIFAVVGMVEQLNELIQFERCRPFLYKF